MTEKVSGSQYMNVSICLLTHNSEKTLPALLDQLLKLDSEIIVVDSGSTDKTLNLIESAMGSGKVFLHKRPYKCHSDQMNHATTLASFDWVLCMDSDEIPSDQFITEFNRMLSSFNAEDTGNVGRIKRNWIVLGRKVHAMYPCSSPDYVVRFFNRRQCRFNDSVVDDKVIGFDHDFILKGEVEHHTFETQEAMDRKLDAYVSRLKTGKKQRQSSRLRAIASACAAFWKWYFVKRAFLDGTVGFKTARYAAQYSYRKYIS